MRPVPCGLRTQRPWIQSFAGADHSIPPPRPASPLRQRDVTAVSQAAVETAPKAEVKAVDSALKCLVSVECLDTLQHWPSAALIYMYLHIPPVSFSNCSSPYIYAEWGNGQEHEDYYVVSCTGLQLNWEWAHGVSG